ncbi:MAG: hypothetical protein ACK5MR_11550 [Cumulibacter sp.]
MTPDDAESALRDDLAVMPGALGEEHPRGERLALQRLAGATFEPEELPTGELCITFPQGRVAVWGQGDDVEQGAIAAEMVPVMAAENAPKMPHR